MSNKIFLFLLCLLSSVGTWSQTLTDLFVGVDSLLMPGAAVGALSSTNTQASPVISNSPCSTPELHFSIATEFGNGRVLAIGHESLVSNGSILEKDNLRFVENALDWLSPGNVQISLREGWINMGNTTILQDRLSTNGYNFSTLNQTITSASLANTDILILGNDWNGSAPYSVPELNELQMFVSNGGPPALAPATVLPYRLY